MFSSPRRVLHDPFQAPCVPLPHVGSSWIISPVGDGILPALGVRIQGRTVCVSLGLAAFTQYNAVEIDSLLHLSIVGSFFIAKQPFIKCIYHNFKISPFLLL